MILTIPTPEMSEWQAHKMLILIRKITNRHTLGNALGRFDVENDSRIPDVARALNISTAALYWRIGEILKW